MSDHRSFWLKPLNNLRVAPQNIYNFYASFFQPSPSNSYRFVAKNRKKIQLRRRHHLQVNSINAELTRRKKLIDLELMMKHNNYFHLCR